MQQSVVKGMKLFYPEKSLQGMFLFHSKKLLKYFLKFHLCLYNSVRHRNVFKWGQRPSVGPHLYTLVLSLSH